MASGLRMAYVAQHAFHHLEKHMQETPTQYIMWRFAGNDDKESLEFKSDKLSVDEEAAREKKWCIDQARGDVRRVTDSKEDAKKAKQEEGEDHGVRGEVAVQADRGQRLGRAGHSDQ